MSTNGWSKSAKRKNARPAVAAVEFAVVLPFLCFLILGLWEVGRMVEVQQIMSNAVREGGRVASMGSKTTDDVKTAVVNYCKVNGLTKVTTSMITITNVTKSSRAPDGAEQLDHFTLKLTVPYDQVQFAALHQITKATALVASADWYSMKDIPVDAFSSIPVVE